VAKNIPDRGDMNMKLSSPLYSPHLSAIIRRDFDFCIKILTGDIKQIYTLIIEHLNSIDLAKTNTQTLMRELRLAKQKIALIVAIAEITRFWNLKKVTWHLSEFANTAIELIVKFQINVSSFFLANLSGNFLFATRRKS